MAAEVPAPTGPLLPRASELERAFAAGAGDPWTFNPGSAEAIRRAATTPAARWDLARVPALSVQARHLDGTRRAVRLRWYVLSHNGGLYAAVKAVTVPGAGSSAEVRVRLAPDAGELAPVGHQRPWDALAASEVLALELHAEVTGSDGSPVRLQLEQPRLATSGAAAENIAARLLDVGLETPPPDIQAEAVLTFRLDPLPEHPFASDGDADVRVQAGLAEALAFLDQDYCATETGPDGRYAAAGAPRYRAYLAMLPQAGNIVVTSGTRTWEIPVEALRGQGIRTRTRPETLSPRWQAPLQSQPATLREPLAANLWASAPSAWLFDPAVRDLWRPAVRPAAPGAWRPVLFWNPRWGGFGGFDRPDLELALQMDAELARAAARAFAQPLVVLDGEGFARQGVFNWTSHPLNAAQGGALAGPGELLRNPAGVEFCRRAARYAIARWSRSRAVNALLLDFDLNAPGAPDLHARLGAAMNAWPGLGAAGKPLYSLHPLACEPPIAAPVGDLLRGLQAAGGAWYAGEPQPARLRATPMDDLQTIEARALAPAGSVCAIKPFNLAAVDYRSRAPDDFHAADALLFDVWLPPDAPPDLRAGVHLRDRDRLWYQTLLPGLLRPGDWTTCLLDLREANAHELKGVGHAKPWTGYSRGRIQEFGLHVFTTHPRHAPAARFARVRTVRFDRLEPTPARKLELLDAPKTVKAGERWECHAAINHTYANPFDVQQADLTALVTAPSGKMLRVPAFFDQPCQRREATPGGDEIVEPAGPERWTVRFRAAETGVHKVVLELRENGRYRIAGQRWAPDRRFSAEGEPFRPAIEDPEDWIYGYEQIDHEGKRRVDRVAFEPGAVTATLDLGAAFTAEAPAESWRGFVRCDEGGRYFRFDDGSFYYPLGPCLRSPSDNRLPYDDPKWNEAFIGKLSRRGTYQYDEYFAAFEKGGINWARVWMCSWWGALQWRRDWPGYQGLQRYNLLNAWRMDHVLDAAERHGIRLNLCLVNHGQYSHVIDTEWQHNPFNAALGGPLKSPAEFFTRAEAKAAHMNMLRYLVARYAHSPALLTWALFSELEFTDEYRPSLQRTDKGMPDLPAPHIESWHAELAGFLKHADPWKHPVSTHFSHPIRGAGIFQVPQIDIAMSNAYSAFDELARGRMDAAEALRDYWAGSGYGGGIFQGMRAYGKPIMVEEQGRHWMGVEWKDGRKVEHNTREQLDADLHAGLWGSLMQPLAGATGYWWWLHVHFDDRYGDYRAFANYLKGEDLRPAKGERVLEPAVLTLDPPFREQAVARTLRSNRRAYLWVYHRRVPLDGGPYPELRNLRVQLTGLAPGAYAIECWDTRTGRITSTAQGVVEAPAIKGMPTQPLTLALPAFSGDLAIKVKAAGIDR